MNVRYAVLVKTVFIFCIATAMPLAQCADAFKNPYFEILKNEFCDSMLKRTPLEEVINSLRRLANAKWPKDSVLSEEMVRVGKIFRDKCFEDHAQSFMQKYETALCEEDARPYLAELYPVFAAEAFFDSLMIDAFYRIIYDRVQASGFTAELGDLPLPDDFLRSLIEAQRQRNNGYYQWFHDSFGI